MVNLTTLVGAPGQIADPQGVATITDDDAPPTLSVNDVAVTEGNAGTTTATFTVSLPAASERRDVQLGDVPRHGRRRVDYVSATGSRDRRRRHQRPVAITVNGDVVDEVNESFTVTLSNPAGATIADGSGAGTITDDDRHRACRSTMSPSRRGTPGPPPPRSPCRWGPPARRR